LIAGPKISTQLISKAAIWHGLSDQVWSNINICKFANCGEKYAFKYAFREINEEKLQMFSFHHKMKIGKKFITKKMLIVNLISLLMFSSGHAVA
jgi:hypothetical protein